MMMMMMMMKRILSLVLVLAAAATTARAATPVVLTNGQTLDNQQVAENGYVLYTFTLPSGEHTDVTFVLTALAGDPDVFIARDHFPANASDAEWAGSTWGGDIINIKHTDPKYCVSPCVYHIAVWGYTPANYSILASSSEVINIIHVGVPARDIIDYVGEYEYFEVTIHRSDINVTIAVTEFAGSVDFFVARDVQRPNASAHTWASTGVGNDTLTIESSDPRYCQSAPCTLYIGVLGITPAEFSVLVSLKSVPTVLLDGLPQRGVVEANSFTYYMVHVADTFHKDIQFTLTPYWGNADLYVRKNELPDQTHHDWESTHYGTDSITVRHTNPAFCSGCTYFVGVWAPYHAHYQIIAHTSNATVQLAVGTPLRIDLPTGDWEFFRLANTRDDVNITFQITAFSGEVDLFASTTDPHPGPGHCTWSIVGASLFGPTNDTLTIGLGDPNYCAPPCTYYIGIEAVAAASLSLLASFNEVPIALQVGQPLEGTVDLGDMKYYYLPVGAVHKDVEFAVSARWGDPDLYVDTRGKPGRTAGTYMWKSAQWGSDIVTVRHNTTGFCRDCTYYIGVFGFQTTAFTVLAMTDSTITTLRVGHPLLESIDYAGDSEYYQVTINDPPNNVTIVATVLAGSLEMYASDTILRPNSTSHVWSATGSNGVIEIPWNDPHACPLSEPSCMLHIGVRALTPGTRFTIVVSTLKLPTLLEDGMPQNGAVDKGELYVYQFYVSGEHREVSIQVAATYGDPDLYASTVDDRPGPHTLGRTYMWRSMHAGTDSITISPYSSPPLCSDCTIYISVYGYSHAHYQIEAATHGATRTLMLGVAVNDVISTADEYAYFQVTVPPPPVDLTFSLTPFSGSARYYLSHWTSRPTANSSHWTSDPAGTLTIPSTDTSACVQICTYYLSVQAIEPVSFSLVASVNKIEIDLVDGQIQSGVVLYHDYDYYRFSVGDLDPHTAITVSLMTIFGGNADLYINPESAGRPSKGHAAWSAEKYGTDTIVMQTGDTGWCGSKCSYLIAVYGRTWQSMQFSLLAYASHGVVTLQSGTPIVETVASGDYDRFAYNVFSNNSDWTTAVTVFAGDVQMFASPSPECATVFGCDVRNATSTPSAAQYLWTDKRLLDIPSSQLCAPCKYYISVQGIGAGSSSRFSIVSEDDGYISVGSGVPQHYEAPPGHNSFFRFTTSDTGAVSIGLSAVMGETELYISTADHLPTHEDYMWRAVPPNALSVIISNLDPHFCSSCTYYVGVSATSAPPAGGDVSFTLTAYDGTGYSALQENVASTGTISGVGGYSRFEAFLPNASSSLNVRAEACLGAVDLWMSDTVLEPTSAVGEHTWGPGTTLPGIAELAVSNAAAGSYYIAASVHSGYYDRAEFEITFTTTSLDIPSPGHDGTLAVQDVAASGFTVSFAPCAGDVGQTYVYAVYYAVSYTQGFHTPCAMRAYGTLVNEVTAAAGADQLHVPVEALLPNHTYVVNVVASRPSGIGHPVAYECATVSTLSTEGTPAGMPWWGVVLLCVGCCVVAVPSGIYTWNRVSRKRTPQLQLQADGPEDPSSAASLVYSAYAEGTQRGAPDAADERQRGLLGKASRRAYEPLPDGDEEGRGAGAVADAVGGEEEEGEGETEAADAAYAPPSLAAAEAGGDNAV